MNYSAPIYKGKNSLIYYQEDNEYGQPVVIKVFPEPVPTIQQLSFFKNEYEIVKDIDIKGIRKALGQTKIDGKAGLVLEYVKGEAISNVLATQSLDLTTFLQIAISLSQTLGEIHQHQIIHLDINNNNMLVDLDSLNTTIIDFGISSRINTKTPHLGNPDTLEGTLAYISPEQTGRMNRLVDYRTDLYSLGVSFYEILTGQLPFSGNNSLEIVHAHIARQAQSPHEVNAQIPVVLSSIVMRLLAKNAEDRYQSAYGLKHDLQQCLEQWQTQQQMEGFELGKQDFSGKFHLIEKLYGREQELKTMLDTVNRVTNGSTELLLVGGYSGIGKSVLVNEVHKPITEKHGHFIKGKYDQFQRDVPYSAINQAFNEFCAHLLTLSEEALAVWREVLQQTLGNNGKVLTEVIPNLEFILGKQPDVIEVGAQEAQNRFNLMMQNFVKVISTKEHPLILFLDDLQWADLASLNLIKLLLADESNQYFLVIGAYRDNEVDAAHPFMLMLDEVKKLNLPITQIQLQNLSAQHVNELITDTLRSQYPERVQALTELIYEKTLGNAFFTTQLLRSIYEDGMLTFDFEQQQWVYELDKIKERQMTDNVVTLMTQKITKLPMPTQEVLKKAACVGNQFDLGVLAAMMEQTQDDDTFHYLWEAIKAGLVAPLDDHYKVFQQKMVVDEAAQINVNPRFRFVHDRIHQASFSLLNAAEQAANSLAIGRLICQKNDQKYIDEYICDIANYYNAGQDLLHDNSEEQLWVIKLNLQAGKKAQTSTAYQSAMRYFDTALELLANYDGWNQHYSISFELYKNKGECEFLLGIFKEAEATLDIALSNANNKFDKVAIYAIQLAQLSLQARYSEACELAIKALNYFGMGLPALDNLAAYQQLMQEEFGLYAQNLGKYSMEDLAALPLMENEDAQIYSQIICWVLDSMILSSHIQVLPYYIAKMLNMSIEYGVNKYIPNAYVFNASLQASQKNYPLAYALVNMAVKLNEERFDVGGVKCKIRHGYNFIRSLGDPMTDAYFLENYQIGLETGDNVYASFSCAVAIRYSFLQSAERAQATANIAIPFLKKVNNVSILANAELSVGMLRCLQGKTNHVFSFDNDPNGGIKQLTNDLFGEGRSPLLWSFLPNFELQLFALFEGYEKGLDHIYNRKQIVDDSGTGTIDMQFRSEFFFYSGVILAHLYAKASPDQQSEYMQILEECLEELRLLAATSKHNFYHLQQGLSAEKARIEGDIVSTMRLYDEAIAQAKEVGFAKDEAFLSELAAKFWFAQDKDDFGSLYIRRAHQLYKNWGAFAKVKNLDNKYPKYLYQSREGSSTGTISRTIKSTLSSSSGSSSLDVGSILKASQALSQEVKIDMLLAKMLHIVIENTGAEKGYLIDHIEGSFWAKAKGDVNTAHGIPEPQLIQDLHDLPLSLVNFVGRRLQTVVLDNASENSQHAQDEYIIQNQPKSVLCYPVFRKGNLSLIFYLENNLVEGAFTPERLEILNMLSSQMAVSIENALLYGNLEQKVTERTAELNKALKDIKFINAQVMDSIYYARRIQNSILITQEQLKNAFADHFVLYLPKDIVSGDFYWMSQRVTDYHMIAVVDCTGHGVPGAFMSIVGTALLNEIINDKGVHDPGNVLKLLDKGVRQTLRQDENSQADGMDVCLCRIKYEADGKVVVCFAGAKRPLIYSSNQQLGELAGTRMSISGWRGNKEEEFNYHQLTLQKGEVLYLTTDGYADMPNPRRRNFTHRRLKHLLDEIKDLPMTTQKERLQENLENYQQDAAQRDDITLLGIRL